MDAIQIIKKDHRQVERLFTEFDRAHRNEDHHQQGRLAEEIVRALSVHAAIEEGILYPALRDEGVGEEVLDALVEHHAAKVLLWEIDHMRPAAERFGAKVRLLGEQVREHIAREERDLLPVLQREFDAERRRKLGVALGRAKLLAPTRPHPIAPDTPPANFVVGAFAAMYDRSRDVVRGGMEIVRNMTFGGASRGARAARDAVKRARRGGEHAISEMRERGQEVAGEAAGRALLGMDRMERRGFQAAREVRERGRAMGRSAAGEARGMAREAKRRGRAAAGQARKSARGGQRGRSGRTPTTYTT